MYPVDKMSIMDCEGKAPVICQVFFRALKITRIALSFLMFSIYIWFGLKIKPNFIPWLTIFPMNMAGIPTWRKRDVQPPRCLPVVSFVGTSEKSSGKHQDWKEHLLRY